jgi:hypothetical protein
MPPKISLEVSRTINLGNFESVRVQAGIEESLDPGITYNDGYQRLFEIVQWNLDLLVEQALNNLKGNTEKSPSPPSASTSRFRVPTVPE